MSCLYYRLKRTGQVHLAASDPAIFAAKTTPSPSTRYRQDG
ncbi:MAG: hypothetical protein ABSA53_34300 [Streptosporangiaceae bacterium]